MRIVGNNPQLSRQTQGTASGAITGGKPVVVNTDGTVSEISATAVAVAASVGSATAFEAAQVGTMDAVFDPDQNKVVIVYPDVGNSGYGTAIVGTISGTSISFGSPTVFESANLASTSKSVCYDTTNNKVVVVYRDQGNSGYLTARVGTVSGTGISFGTVSVIRSTQAFYTSCAYHAQENKIAAVYQDASNSQIGYIISFPVSGTGIGTVGNYAVFSDNNSVHELWRPSALVYDSNAEDLVVVYLDTANSNRLTAKVCRINGTNWTFGSAAIVDSGTSSEWSTVFDSNSNKIVVVYRDSNNSNYGTAKVGTVSGTDISFGSGTVFAEHGSPSFTRIAFDSNVNKVIIPYRGTSKGRINTGTVSGTGISFDGESIFNDNNSNRNIAVFDSNTNKTAIMYMDSGNSNHGYASVFSHASTTSNLSASTSESFIGFAQDTVATGQPVTINTKGAIADNMPQVAAAAAVGTKVEFNAADTSQTIASVFDPDTNKVIIAFSDEGNSSYGTVVVATIDSSDNSVTYGSKVVFNSAQTSSSVMVYDTNSDRIVIGYTTNFTSLTGTSIVGTVSGSSVSFGSAVGFNGSTHKLGVTFDSNSNKVVFGYEDGGNSGHGTAIVGTVDPSDNSISFGSEAVYKAADTSDVGMCFDTNSNKVVIVYRHNADSSKGEAIVGTVSGTSISYGSATVFNSVNTQQFATSVVFDGSNNKVVIIYKDSGGSGASEAQVGTVSGTSISFGTLATVPDSNGGIQAATFDSDNNNIILAYQDDGEHGNVVIGTVSGTDISFNTPVEFESGDYVSPKAVAYDTNIKRALIAFQDTAASGHGQGIVYSPAGDVDLTPAQTYFVQTDGTLSETADDPSVTAGTAVAGSTLIVKG